MRPYPNVSIGFLIITIGLASFITPFTSTSAILTFKQLTQEFRISLANANWVSSVFLIALSMCILLFGKLADVFNKSLVLVLGTSVFAISSLLISFTDSYQHLLFFRFLQGVGSAMISATAIAVLSDEVPREKRGLAIGVNTTAVYLGTTLGPIIGGYVVDAYGWRTLFILKAFMALVSLTMSLTMVKPTIVHRAGHLNYVYLLRQSLMMLALICIVYYSATPQAYFGPTLFAVGLALFVLLLILELRSPVILHRGIIKAKCMLIYVITLLIYASTFAITTILSNYLQKIRELKAGESGLIVSAQYVAQASLSPLVGFLADRYNPMTLMMLGCITVSSGITSLTTISSTTTITYIVSALILLGIGFAFFTTSGTIALVNMVPRDTYATATAFLGTMRFLGQALSISILMQIMSLEPDILRASRISLTVYSIISVLNIAFSILAKIRK